MHYAKIIKSFPMDNSKATLSDLMNKFFAENPGIKVIQIFSAGSVDGPAISPRETAMFTGILYEKDDSFAK